MGRRRLPVYLGRLYGRQSQFESSGEFEVKPVGNLFKKAFGNEAMIDDKIALFQTLFDYFYEQENH
jgi:hypothetical protein